NQGLMVARIADPGLVAQHLRGEPGLANLSERDGDARVADVRERMPVPLGEGGEIGGRAAHAERTLGEQAVKGLAEPGGGAQPRLDALRMATGGVGARRPIMAGRG